METIIKRLSNLLSVKSLVTLVLTGVFAFMACTNQISQDFMTIYAAGVATRVRPTAEPSTPPTAFPILGQTR